MERKIYLNGEWVSEQDAKVSIFDIGRLYGATFYESVRTFKHKPFKLDEHLDRLEKSIRYARLGSLVERGEMAEIIQKTIDVNEHLTEKDDDLWVCAEVTPGVGFPQPLMKVDDKSPTIMVYSSPLPHNEYVKYYSEGKCAVVSEIRNVAPETYDSRVKNRSRLHFFIAKLDAAKRDPDAFALLMDNQGYISEGTGANFFIVTSGTLYTPTTRNILNGITRLTTIELAKKIGLPVTETDINLYDVLNADEAFFTTTSYCILPVSKVNDMKIGRNIPGDWTAKLTDAWSELAGLDIVGQAEKYSRAG